MSKQQKLGTQNKMTFTSRRQFKHLVQLAGTIFSCYALTACTYNNSTVVSASRSVQPESAQPESATGLNQQQLVKGRQHMAATANPHASRAALRILRAGGSALDAAIAAQWVLTLVEPQSSGLGGGLFLLHYRKQGGRVEAYDGRETAPALATEKLFLDAAGKPLKFHEAAVGGRAVGVPGVVAALELAHQEHGKLPWAQLFEPAIELATKGFEVSPRLNKLLAFDVYLKNDANARQYFFDVQGEAWPVGHILKNPALALTFSKIARNGSKGFYQSEVAQAMLTAVNSHPTNPGLLSQSDLSSYRAIKREAICTQAFKHRVCGFPPPSSGGIAVAQIAALLELSQAPPLIVKNNVTANTEIPNDYTLTTEGLHYFTEASRLAFADRNRYIADPAFSAWSKDLLSQQYLNDRAALIKPNQSLKIALPGQPKEVAAILSEGLVQDKASTSHISIVDQDGNAVSMTTSIEDVFGARLMTQGFLLNNQLTDFSFIPSDEKGTVANRAQANKRPRSSMAPTMVFDEQGKQLKLVAGSPGGAQIINYVAKLITLNLRDGIDVQTAISLPNFGSRNGPTELEKDRFTSTIVERLKTMGHEVRLIDMTSGLQAISVDAAGQLLGGADPRREGLVLAD
jgi:gamma-glutamyltranspeptidase / glutathione hydrolase